MIEENKLGIDWFVDDSMPDDNTIAIIPPMTTYTIYCHETHKDRIVIKSKTYTWTEKEND
jgi:hypothetical protein